MLKGDLVTTPLPAVLRQLADGVASGCLHVDDGVGGQAKVFLRGGQVYSVQVPGRRPQLGARLVSSGALGPEALAEALEAQRTELQGWRLGELLVHLGYVDQPVVEAFVDEQLREQATDLMRWPTGTWKFRLNERTREDVAPPTSVEDLLASVEQRRAQWDTITELLHGPDAVPMLSAAGQTDTEMSIDPEAWSLLCKVDGVRSLSDLAVECGFTLFEAGQVVYSLVRSGLLEVEEVVVGPETAAPAPAFPDESVTARLAAAFAPADEIVIPAQAHEMDPADVANLIANALREDRTLDVPPDHDEIDASVGRVSRALSALLGDSASTEALFAAPKPRRGKAKPDRPKTASEIDREKRQAARAEASAKRRAADADELAQAQAELEAARAAEAADAHAELDADHEAEIVNLDAARQAAEERAAEEAARLAAEEEAEAERLAAEQEAARLAAEQEAARLAAEQAEAERLAAEEAARLAAEQEAARLAAEQEEWARLTAEAEERARVEAELRAAADAEAAETARLALAAEEAEVTRVAAELEAAEAALAAAEAEEQSRSVEQRAHAADVFAELSATAASAGDTLVETVVEASLETHQDVDEIDDRPLPTYPPADTDMASLFRELSSLGLDDEPSAPSPSRPAPRATPPAAPAKQKKKGLFGR
ncbi:MAG: hypothetical protein JWM22_1741 [Frankiales bacterium]|nr:hypothetical protein [Frankiales bacterium]